ncbi:MFS transporter [Alteromonas sp. ASW11-36]|uniref:MFS transporter n=1 Tax=Alteromonas arenosi TaxID=3055817 RepID=A0ABT7SV14_9ALTE|nr:MFS transporter [Alteromonas sp. ASW11-36]MDM7860033.1 MFS transporter [Alteromonas sp. ASW11-36]
MKRLSTTYFLYFALLGVIVPYLGIFLDGRGFTSAQIGELFALITVARILGPSLWASIADRSGKTLLVLQVGCLLTVVSFIGVFWAHDFWWLTLVFALMMMFWTAVLPQLEVITLHQAELRKRNYGGVRSWGSVGFIVLTILTGHLLDIYGTEVPIYISMVLLTLLFVSTLWIANSTPERDTGAKQSTQWQAALKPVFVIFILSTALLQVSFGAYYGFFALYMRDLGHSGQLTGVLIALGVLAEIGIFLLAQRVISHYGIKLLLIASMLLTALRWWLLGALPDLIVILVFAQLLHAFSFGLTHAVSVEFIHRYFDRSFQSRGQAIYISIGFGVGGAFGNWLAGQLWQQGSGAQLAFNISAIVAVLAGLILMPLAKQKLGG